MVGVYAFLYNIERDSNIFSVHIKYTNAGSMVGSAGYKYFTRR
jgi:hypothetical protein